jgi:hypothetical protein
MEGFYRKIKELDFRRRLSGVVFKPPYAAYYRNKFVVSDKEKLEQRFQKVSIKELNVSEPMMKSRKEINDVKSG